MTSCTAFPDKQQYATRDDALAQVKAVVYRNHVNGTDHRSVGLAPYPCDTCGLWHIGHGEKTPPVWHYTTMQALDPILASDMLRPSRPLKPSRQASQEERCITMLLAEREPLLWFSRNPEWEYSVDKIKATTAGRAAMEVTFGGLLRFGVPSVYAKLRWADYLARNPIPKTIRTDLLARGNPAEWVATDEPVSLEHVRSIEVYLRAWLPVDAVDEAMFATYIAQRRAEYRQAEATLNTKLTTAERELTPDQRHIDMTLNEAEWILWRDYKMRRDTRDVGNIVALRDALRG
jgi:hypothetical protein